ncbi:MAG: carbohydrate kinase [Bacteroidaceae bacterium]|jgi:fructokinase|nr:carbohydrate kinase [Bacteroidaceae bacterium]MBR6819559.1 carbohydrate kinase [Bacteroidaceae bacterium]
MIYAIGETVMDILFKEDKPIDAVPGGSAFNSVISIGRVGVPCAFIGYTGKDHVGDLTVDFLKANSVDVRYFEQKDKVKSCISLAFLDERGDAHYVFYKDTPVSNSLLDRKLEFQAGDVLLLGSYYAISAGTRNQIKGVLDAAVAAGATVYYDLNFRSSHKEELPELMPAILDNFRRATVVRGSADDFEVMWGERDARKIYKEHIARYCRIFICTSGAGRITVCTPDDAWDFDVQQVADVVSTVGAGDNFNAGFLCALSRRQMSLSGSIDKADMAPLIESGVRFASAVCRSTENYVPVSFKL